MNPKTSSVKRLATRALAALTGALLVAPLPGAAADDGAPAVPLSSCWSSDAGLPTFGTPVFEPATVDVTDGPQSVRISLPVEDHGSPGPATGVAGVDVWLLDQRVRLNPGTGDTWSGTVVVQRRTAPGTHTVEAVTAMDKAGNARESSEDGVNYPQLATPLTVVSDPVQNPPAPTLTSLTVSKKKVDVRKKKRTVAFHLAVDESTTAVQRAVVHFNSRPSRHVVLSRTSNGFTGKATVARSWSGTYKAKVASIELLDEHGFVRYTHSGKLAKQFGTEPVTVTSRKDRRAPRIVKSTVTPTSVDARSGTRKVTVKVRARDDRSGVKSVDVHLGPDIAVTMKKVKGTRKAGTWKGSVKVGPCDVPYMQGRLWVQLRDRALKYDEGFGARIKMRSNDVRRPGVRLPHPGGAVRNWPVDKPIRIVLGERVTGVNSDSVQVVRLDDGFWSEPLAGTLECRNPSGVTVPCGSRRVKKVRWHPGPGVLEPGRDYSVMVNPDGVLDLRDRAGNPARRQELGFGTRQG